MNTSEAFRRAENTSLHGRARVKGLLRLPACGSTSSADMDVSSYFSTYGSLQFLFPTQTGMHI